ncbi:MAG TPA: hypothetical protein VN872_10910 [Candidatus Acidoferrum sp.]|nr:hypothetical protein [Candidatus Acidoferrum sp.]
MLANMNAQAPGAAVAYMPPQGGPGGGQYIAQCGPTENLMGFELRVGTFIDAIRPVCVVTYGATAIGNQVVPPTWNGGTGGHAEKLLCPASTPIVIAVAVGVSGTVEDISTVVVSAIHLYCGQAVAAQTPAALPSAVFDGPGSTRVGTFVGAPQVCPAGQVAVGVHGRAGTWLDAMGLICGAPRKDTSGKVLGRAEPTTPAVAMSICDRAKDARARNSPAAAALEAQCNAPAQLTGPPKVLGRTGTPNPNAGSVPICDQAQDARARNSPVAPQLEARCRAIGGGQGMPVEETPDQFAARGQILASQDALIAELRRRQPTANLRGFDVGMGAAEGQREWGPGKEKMLASLNAAEQQGFKVAVSFSLDRNRNAQFAAIGAAIAQADPAVASARTSDPEVRAWLGFDIASGIFGDPAKGALTQTSGLQALAIREQLSLPAKRGFDASKQLHLSRHYKPAQ